MLRRVARPCTRASTVSGFLSGAVETGGKPHAGRKPPVPGDAGPGTSTVANGHRIPRGCHRPGATHTVTSAFADPRSEVVTTVPSTEITWPSEADLRVAEHDEFALLCRVLAGLRRLSDSDETPAPSGVAMTRATQNLVDVLLAVDARIRVLTTQLTDGTAAPDEQRGFADQFEEVADLLRSHADDIDAEIVAAPDHPAPTE